MPTNSNSVAAQTVARSVLVPAPERGATISVNSEAGGRLDFAFDPAEATASRPEGSNDLLFDLDNGGRVVVSDFFAVGDESLPDLALPDGLVIAATDFFAASDLDLSTAAGATAPPPSSGSDGSGDPLSMTEGLDRLGTQGTQYWGYESERDEIYEGRDRTGGEGAFGGLGDVGGIVYDPIIIGDVTGTLVRESETYREMNTDDPSRWQGLEASAPGDVSFVQGTIPLSYGTLGPAAENAFKWDVNSLRDDLKTYDSDGKEVSLVWELSADGLTLVGYPEGDRGNPIITVTATGMTDAGMGYDVTLHGGVVHDKDSGEDLGLDLNAGFTVTDSAGNQASGSLPVTVVDDNLELGGDNQTATWGDGHSVGYDFAHGFAHGDSDLKVDENGVARLDGLNISVGSITYGENGSMILDVNGASGNLNVWGGQGLGVYGSDYDQQIWDNAAGYVTGKEAMDDKLAQGGEVDAGKDLSRPMEIGFDNTGDRNSSEAVVITLDKPASSMTLNLSQFYSGVSWENDEKGVVIFYKLINGEYVQVHSEIFDANSSSGLYSGTFPNGYSGTFDMVVLAGVEVTDHDDTKSPAVPDNSDFVLSGVFFDNPCAEAEGQISGHGADGVQGFTFGDIDNWSCVTADGRVITLDVDEHGVLYGRFEGSDDAAFTITLDSQSGEWSFSMLEPFSPKDDFPEIPVAGVDHDGDTVAGSGIQLEIAARVVDDFAGDKTQVTGISGVEEVFVWNAENMSAGKDVDAIHNFELGTDKINFQVPGMEDLLEGANADTISQLLNSGAIDIFRSDYNQDCWTLRMSGSGDNDGQMVDIFIDKNSLSDEGQQLLNSVGNQASDTKVDDQVALLQMLLGSGMA